MDGKWCRKKRKKESAEHLKKKNLHKISMSLTNDSDGNDCNLVKWPIVFTLRPSDTNATVINILIFKSKVFFWSGRSM